MHTTEDKGWNRGTLPRRAAYSVAAFAMVTAIGVSALQTQRPGQDPQPIGQTGQTSQAGQTADVSLSQANQEFRRAVSSVVQKAASKHGQTIEQNAILATSCGSSNVIAGAPVSGSGMSTPPAGQTDPRTGGMDPMAKGDVIGLLVIEGTFQKSQSGASQASGSTGAMGSTGSTISTGAYKVRKSMASCELVDENDRVVLTIPLGPSIHIGQAGGLGRDKELDREDDLGREDGVDRQDPAAREASMTRPSSSDSSKEWSMVYATILKELQPSSRF